ncbi:aconitate hydratase [Acidimangrovimonas pyrenivorans]|uniref:Aconitate hydratase A n=1 Tax=Acidimangrovimonas pyrenivorans TaxID=2030798 RepID=A0ABV7ADW9_9RHOB
MTDFPYIRSDADGDRYVDVAALFAAHGQDAGQVPRTIRLLAEAAARACAEGRLSAAELATAVGWTPQAAGTGQELRFPVGRVVLQDASGLPLLTDLAALRDAVRRAGGDAAQVNPAVPVTMVIDHSVTIEQNRGPGAFAHNLKREAEVNAERYQFARWAAAAFDNLSIVPPGNGIIHQIHMETLVEVVSRRDGWRFSDLVIGTDSHTTMIGGLGVLGWGTGGIEAEEAVLGGLLSLPAPELVEVELCGKLPPGVSATDAALTLTQWLRRQGVVGALLEFHGPGVAALGIADRATIANMAPEYGATSALFPLDAEVLTYLERNGAPREHLQTIRAHLLTDVQPGEGVAYNRRLHFDLDLVIPSVAGPSRPDQRLPLAALPSVIEGPGSPAALPTASDEGLRAGDIVIAAITSCTNTANPDAMITAALVARNALRRGMKVPAHVRTSLAPGSRRVAEYLGQLDLLAPLEALGFAVSAFGCATCVGNSGPLAPQISRQISGRGLNVAAVLSGNRNFEARIHPLVRSNILMSPALVVAFALCGTLCRDLTRDPVGTDAAGHPVLLSDLWPDEAEVRALLGRIGSGPAHFVTPESWTEQAGPVGPFWPWQPGSTHFIEPPFFAPGFSAQVRELAGARPLLVLGDGVTTDHISPVGPIASESETGRYLAAKGVATGRLGTYAGRRGNHEAMLRGTFANARLRNLLADGRDGPWTRHMTSGEIVPVTSAAARYRRDGVAAVILAGDGYGMGSARDWAAKGTRLLGVRAVVARSFERIHRTNLIRVGVVPLRPVTGGLEGIDLTGEIEISSTGLTPLHQPGQAVTLTITSAAGTATLDCVLEARTETELDLLRAGGLFERVRRDFLANAAGPEQDVPESAGMPPGRAAVADPERKIVQDG